MSKQSPTGTNWYRKQGWTKAITVKESTYHKLRKRAFDDERSLQTTTRRLLEKSTGTLNDGA